MNWLELFATAEFIGRERAEAVARRAPVYTRIYRTVIDDYETIGAMLRDVGVQPLPLATGGSPVQRPRP